MAEFVEVRLTEGNIKNNHVYLSSIEHFFPRSVFGGSNSESAAPSSVRVVFVPGSTVETDIAGDKKILRSRAGIREFFHLSGAQMGGKVLITRLGEKEYQFDLVKR